MDSKAVQDALIERGVNLPDLSTIEDQWKSAALTPEQLIVANTMLDMYDGRSNKKRLSDLGVKSATYQSWLRDPVFRDYLKRRAEALFGDLEHEAYLALMDRVAAGDIKALEFYFEMTGKYTRVSASNRGSDLDLQAILTQIILVVTDEVTDPQMVVRITERLKKLGTAHHVAGNVLESGEEIIVPQIAENRELTPELQLMLAQGKGVNS